MPGTPSAFHQLCAACGLLIYCVKLSAATSFAAFDVYSDSMSLAPTVRLHMCDCPHVGEHLRARRNGTICTKNVSCSGAAPGLHSLSFRIALKNQSRSTYGQTASTVANRGVLLSMSNATIDTQSA